MNIYLGRRSVDNTYGLSQTKQDWDPKFGFYLSWIPYKDIGDFLKPGEIIEVDVKLRRKK